MTNINFFDEILSILSTMSEGMSAMYDTITLTFTDVVTPILIEIPFIGDLLGSALDNSWLGGQSFVGLVFGSSVIVILVIKIVKGIF